MSTDHAARPSLRRLRPLRALTGILLLAGLLEACAYRIDIQQGNLLEEDALDQVQLGMSRSAVQFLLGTPMIADAFHEQRWDYAYYFRQGRSREVEQRWIVVYFEQDRVVRIERDLELRPAG
jgi:outer membrane protein assembly factor BamE (lipoprotein component of BamABCDE complex)